MASSSCLLTSLPPGVLQASVLSRLSLSDLGRCACVSRGWQCAVYAPANWARVSLVGIRDAPSALNTVLARATDGIEHLDVTDTNIPFDALREVVRANASSLSVLLGAVRVGAPPHRWFELANAAPRLTLLRVTLAGLALDGRQFLVREVVQMLRCVPPHGAAHIEVCRLDLNRGEIMQGEEREAFLSAVAKSTTLNELNVHGMCYCLPSRDSLRSVAACACLRVFSWTDCPYMLSPRFTAALLAGGQLESFTLAATGPTSRFLQFGHAAWRQELKVSLARCVNLSTLALRNVGLFYRDPDTLAPSALVDFLRDLVSLPTLTSLDLSLNDCGLRGAGDAHAFTLRGALALLARPASRLTDLSLAGCGLNDEAARGLVSALPSSRLQRVDMSGSRFSRKFVEHEVAGAVAASVAAQRVLVVTL